MLVGRAKQLEAYLSQFFADFELFIILTIFSDAKMSRSGDFSDDDWQQMIDRQNWLLYPLCMHVG